MPFIDIKLSDVELEKPAGLAIGTYTFQLVPGAEYRINKYTEKEELNVSAAVAEGEMAGRRVFFSFPDPTAESKSGKSMKWSAQALKKFEISLGVDALPGEDSASYLNRVAMNGAGRFKGSLVAETRKNPETNKYEPYIREGETEPRGVFSIFSFAPSA